MLVVGLHVTNLYFSSLSDFSSGENVLRWYVKNKALSLLRGKNKKGDTWAGVFVVTGDGDSLTFGSLGDAADPCDSWLAGWSGDKASLLSSSNEKSPWVWG